MESHNINTSLSEYIIEIRDNGDLTMGNIIRIISLHPINILMSRYIPKINIQFPIIFMGHPLIFSPVPIKF